MTPTPYSLRWRLILRLAMLQALVVLIVVSGLLVALWRVGAVNDDQLIPVAAAAVRLDGDRLEVSSTPALEALHRRYPGFWVVAATDDGRKAIYGSPPTQFLGGRAEAMPFGKIQIWGPDGKGAPIAYFERVGSTVGQLNLIVGIKAKADTAVLLGAIVKTTLMVTVPLVALISLVLFLATSLVVRNAFRQLADIVGQAGRITFADRGFRLPTDLGPRETQPLIGAINAALDRLDEGYARRTRFLTDAAHELRTPIAIIQTRLDGMEASADVRRLQRDVARLATMAEQMLDLQRLEGAGQPFHLVDLVVIARTVASDLAPLVQRSGASLSLEAEIAAARIPGDALALERALANLVLNAVEHGGPEIVVRVRATALEVEDNGQGIPADERERVFEPFYRRTGRATGAGLGLSLVQQVARIHGGRASAQASPGGGAVMRIDLPAAARLVPFGPENDGTGPEPAAV